MNLEKKDFSLRLSKKKKIIYLIFKYFDKEFDKKRRYYLKLIDALRWNSHLFEKLEESCISFIDKNFDLWLKKKEIHRDEFSPNFPIYRF